MRQPTDVERTVRMSRRTITTHYLNEKRIYKRQRIELTIPAKFKHIIEPFLNKDLKVEAIAEGNRLHINVETAESLRKSAWDSTKNK